MHGGQPPTSRKPLLTFEILVVPLQYYNVLKDSIKFINYLRRTKFMFILLEAQTHTSQDAPQQSAGGWSVPASNNVPVYQYQLPQSPCNIYIVGRGKCTAGNKMNNNWHTTDSRSFQTIFHRPYVHTQEKHALFCRTEKQILTILRSTSLPFYL